MHLRIRAQPQLPLLADGAKSVEGRRELARPTHLNFSSQKFKVKYLNYWVCPGEVGAFSGNIVDLQKTNVFREDLKCKCEKGLCFLGFVLCSVRSASS